jgi:hypothetical protein
VAVLEAELPPVYQRIAHKALQFRRIGFSLSLTAKTLRVTDKTVVKAVNWALREALGEDPKS